MKASSSNDLVGRLARRVRAELPAPPWRRKARLLALSGSCCARRLSPWPPAASPAGAAAGRHRSESASSAQDPGEHALLHIKSNVSVLGVAIGYRVDECGFSWTGESRLTAADLLAAESAGDERAADEEARTFLRELLADGPMAARKVLEEARKVGISEITLRRAKAREGMEAKKVGFQDGAKWLWSTPSKIEDDYD
jgi:hypothetical protein